MSDEQPGQVARSKFGGNPAIVAKLAGRLSAPAPTARELEVLSLARPR